MDHIKELYHLITKQLDADRLKDLEKEGKEPSTSKTSYVDDAILTMNDKSLLASTSVASSSSPDSACALPPKHQLQLPKQHSPAAADHGEGKKKKKRRYIYAPSTIEILEASSSPMSISLYSSMQLPFGCLAEHDGCDSAELIARAKRCHEILRLSQQVKGEGCKRRRRRSCCWS